MQSAAPDSLPAERMLEGAAACEQALDELIGNAARTVRIFDKNAGRGFNSPRRYELLRQLLLAKRTNRLYLVLHDAANLSRDCPRLIMLLRQFSHAVHIHQTRRDARRIYDAFAVADDARFVRRFHYDDVRGVATVGDAAATGVLLMRFEEIWQASAPAVAATTLGL